MEFGTNVLVSFTVSRVTYLSAGGSAGPELRVGVEDPVAVWGGGAGVGHRDGAGRRVRWGGLVVFPSVGDGDGEWPEARNAATIPSNEMVRDGFWKPRVQEHTWSWWQRGVIWRKRRPPRGRDPPGRSPHPQGVTGTTAECWSRGTE